MDFSALTLSAGVVALAEMGDKTQTAVTFIAIGIAALIWS